MRANAALLTVEAEAAQQFGYGGHAFVIIHAGGPNGKLVRSGRAVEEGTGAGTQRSPAHRRSSGRTRQQQLEAHDLCSEPEQDGGSAESKVGESQARLTTRCESARTDQCGTKQNAPDSV